MGRIPAVSSSSIPLKTGFPPDEEVLVFWLWAGAGTPQYLHKNKGTNFKPRGVEFFHFSYIFWHVLFLETTIVPLELFCWTVDEDPLHSFILRRLQSDMWSWCCCSMVWDGWRNRHKCIGYLWSQKCSFIISMQLASLRIRQQEHAISILGWPALMQTPINFLLPISW